MTVITLASVRKRNFVLPTIAYKSSDLVVDAGDRLIARNGDAIIARNGDRIITHRYATLGTRQILQARKRSFTLPMVVIDG